MSLDLNASIITVSDITERVEELREERALLVEAEETANLELEEFRANPEACPDRTEALIVEGIDDAEDGLASWDAATGPELAQLEAILDDLKGNGGDHEWEGDWYPSHLISEYHFEAYMDEMIVDIEAIPRNLPSYLKVTVDYDALKMDYSEVEVLDCTYWYR